jgi:CBS domain-containing protein
MNWSQPVRNLMTAEPRAIGVDASPSEVRALLEEQLFHHLPVLDGDVLVGIVSAVDLARVSLGAWVENPATVGAWLDAHFRIRDLMTFEPECIGADDPVRRAADKLSAGTFHSLPVLDDEGRLVGMLTSTDLIRAIAHA